MPITTPESITITDVPLPPPSPRRRGWWIFGAITILLAASAVLVTKGFQKKPLGEGYHKNWFAIYYTEACHAGIFPVSEGGCTLKKVPGADVRTFQVIHPLQPVSPFTQGIYAGYGKDKNHVYLLGKPLANVDSASFEYIGRSYSRDKNGAYAEHSSGGAACCDRYPGEGVLDRVLDGGVNLYVLTNDPDKAARMEVFAGSGFAKVAGTVYNDGEKMETADASTFRKINDCYFADVSNIFNPDGSAVPAETASLRQVDSACAYVANAKHVYGRSAKVIPEADPASFHMLNASDPMASVALDKNYVFDDGQLVPEADPKTFHWVDGGCYADIHSVYKTKSWRLEPIGTNANASREEIIHLCRQ